MQLAAGDAVDITPGSELVVARGSENNSSSATRPAVIGHRGFKHLYRQRHRPAPAAQGAQLAHAAQRAQGSASAGGVVAAQYRRLGVPQVTAAELAQRRDRRKLDRRRDWGRLKSEQANAKIQQLPKNVPY